MLLPGYSIDGGQKINFTNYNEPITDTILLSNTVKNRKIRIYVMWNDNEKLGATMTNVDDTLATKSTNPVIFNVKLSFTQITP